MRLEIALLLLPLTYNVIDLIENRFVNIYIPYIGYEEVIEVPYTYMVKTRTNLNITIKALASDKEYVIYTKDVSSGSKDYVSDYFPVSGHWFKNDVTFLFQADVSSQIFEARLYMPFKEKITYEFAGEFSIVNSDLYGINGRGKVISLEESINLSYISSSPMKFDLSDFSFTYNNDWNSEVSYSKANLKITDKSNVFSFIPKEDDAFIIPLELAKIDDDIIMSFQESIYLEQSSLSTYFYYKEGLISQNKKLYYPLDHKIKDAYIEVELTIESIGYGNTCLKFMEDIFLACNTMGLCSSSEVCVKHV